MQIQDETGARIHFKDEADSDKKERVVLIRGTPKSAQSAELLIRDIIAKHPPEITKEIHVPQRALGRIIGKQMFIITI